jgi:hypothetical protein
LAFSPVFFCGWAFVAGGVGVDFAGGVCANAGGNIALVTAIAVTNPIALNEYFTYGLIRNIPCGHVVRRGPLPTFIMTLLAA